MKHKVSKLVALEPDPGGHGEDDIPSRPMSPLEAACFIEGMAAELRAMARDARLSALSYFLEMARIEASAEVERLASPRSERH
ncbi:hypothetical protein [Bosea robiniae]|jgi:hypothetical protein|uniref:Uncharacterized protein n=1 Tax=Bosea robiniae TaxID=1036780 RepID=A0ABY0NCD3_9HYPH|nr:hypothetical protein [Bosea robiniae]SDF26302.1 hypothetical protein SAMN05421844_101197 [Bosea robiniae]